MSFTNFTFVNLYLLQGFYEELMILTKYKTMNYLCLIIDMILSSENQY